MKRLFAAIKIKPSSNFLEISDALKKGLKHEKIKWVEPNNLHLTLKFFGETQEDKIPEIVNALKLGLEKHNKFSLQISTLGIFGSKYNPKLIWVGLQPTDPLIQLVSSVHTELDKIGYFQDRQNFVPHLTLGRIKNLSDKNLFQNIISKHRENYFQEICVKEVYLFESTLTKDGPLYQIIETFDLD